MADPRNRTEKFKPGMTPPRHRAQGIHIQEEVIIPVHGIQIIKITITMAWVAVHLVRQIEMVICLTDNLVRGIIRIDKIIEALIMVMIMDTEDGILEVDRAEVEEGLIKVQMLEDQG